MATQNVKVKQLEAPFDKFVVDGFHFVAQLPDVRHWFLSHAHSDHTCGLNARFDAGTIYCSRITRDLVCRDISRRLEKRIAVIDVGDTLEVDEDCRVTAYCAGHCPGSLLFWFERDGTTLLHTGDFRASEAVRAQFAGVRVDSLYLDTTYANPRFAFPSQADACDLISEVSSRYDLVVCPAYSIGKENAIEAAVRGTSGKAYVSERRLEALELCARAGDDTYTTDATDPDVRVVVDSFGGAPTKKGAKKETPHEALRRRFGCEKRVLQLNCTGWTFRKSSWDERTGRYAPKFWTEENTTVCGIPYSEHSSFPELVAFVALVRPKKLVPTVNAEDKTSRQKLISLFAKHLDGSRSTLDAWLTRKTLAPALPKKKRKRADAELVPHVRAVLAHVTERRAAKLLSMANNDVSRAIELHLDDQDDAESSEESDSDSLDGRDLLLGAVFAVSGGTFKLFKASDDKDAAERIRERLAELGATVVDKARGKKFAATHLIVPEGTDPGTVRSLVVVKEESWLIRKLRALQAGRVQPPTAQQRRTAEKRLLPTKTKKKIDVCSITKRKRKGPRRRPTKATETRVDRALEEKMFLLRFRDDTPPSQGRAPRVLTFAVLGSTGNAYSVTFSSEPSCDCPYATAHPADVCKHRFFLCFKVLGFDRDDDDAAFADVPYQRYLRYDELEYLFDNASQRLPHLASKAARAAYATLVGDDFETHDENDAVQPPPEKEEDTCCCAVCFDEVSASSEEGTTRCRRGCGRRLHAACLRAWLEHASGAPSCPSCRAPWVFDDDPGGATPITTEDGFFNLRQLQPGLPAARDTSSYALDDQGRQWKDRHAERAAAPALFASSPSW